MQLPPFHPSRKRVASFATVVRGAACLALAATAATHARAAARFIDVEGRRCEVLWETRKMDCRAMWRAIQDDAPDENPEWSALRLPSDTWVALVGYCTHWIGPVGDESEGAASNPRVIAHGIFSGFWMIERVRGLRYSSGGGRCENWVSASVEPQGAELSASRRGKKDGSFRPGRFYIFCLQGDVPEPENPEREFSYSMIDVVDRLFAVVELVPTFRAPRTRNAVLQVDPSALLEFRVIRTFPATSWSEQVDEVTFQLIREGNLMHWRTRNREGTTRLNARVDDIFRYAINAATWRPATEEEIETLDDQAVRLSRVELRVAAGSGVRDVTIRFTNVGPPLMEVAPGRWLAAAGMVGLDDYVEEWIRTTDPKSIQTR